MVYKILKIKNETNLVKYGGVGALISYWCGCLEKYHTWMGVLFLHTRFVLGDGPDLNSKTTIGVVTVLSWTFFL